MAMRSTDTLARLARALERPLGPTSDFDYIRHAAAPGSAPLRPAAVLIGLQDGPAGPTILLTRRARGLRHHPGQIAFPGGRLDPGDTGPEAAALREAQEEVALDPASVRLIGRLPMHRTVTGFAVTPVVGLIERPFTPAMDQREVAEVFTVPFAHVTDLGRFAVEQRPWQGGWRGYDVVPWGPYYIWGATARILRQLAQGMAD